MLLDDTRNTIDFIAIAKCDNCLSIEILESIDLSNSILKILGENRNVLVEIKNPEYKISLCIYTGKPMFVELHTSSRVSVHYVEGSGGDFYNDLNN
jgi:hypothetical protein